MPIGNVTQQGNAIFVFDEKGRRILEKHFGFGRGDGLKGYTGSTFSVKWGATLYTFDEKGRQISARIN